MGTKKRNQKRAADLGVAWGKGTELGWDQIGREAAERAGRGPQLKGIVHEVAFKTKLNADPLRAFQGKTTHLTASSTARWVDAYTQKAGRIHERFQLKDCESTSGLRDLQNRLDAGAYRNTRLVGTEETAAGWQARGGARTMESSGISSRRTTRVAENAGAKVRTADTLAGNLRDIGGMAGSAALLGGVFGGVGEAASSLSEVRRGDITGGEYAGRIASATAVSGATAGAKTASALILKEGAKQVAMRTANETARRLVGGTPATAVAFGVVEQGIHIARYTKGDISGAEFGARTMGTVGSTGGTIAGIAAGAALGSAVPVVGTIIGGVVGGILGSVLGGTAGKAAGNGLFRPDAKRRR